MSDNVGMLNRIAGNGCDLADKIAIVTGSARGMGFSIAASLLDCGAAVCISDLNGEAADTAVEKLSLHGERVFAIPCDVRNQQQVEQMIEAVADRYGTVDILVNNAGVLFPTNIGDISAEEWLLVMDVNLNGPFYCSKAVLPYMKKRRFGRIINMSSSAGRSVSTLGGAHYTASKAGLLGLTRAMAKEVSSFGITVNAVCPGLIDTEMVRSDCSPDTIRAYEEQFPIPRLGRPEEIADPVAFLCSEAAAYITGASIDINGGDLMM